MVTGCNLTMRVPSFAVFLRRGRGVGVLTFAGKGIVEGPVLDLALPSLHDGAADLVETVAEGVEIAGREVLVGPGQGQIPGDPVETKFIVALGERKRVIGRDRIPVFQPFVHAPEVGFQLSEVEAGGR